MRFEYKVFNLSEVSAIKGSNLISVLNNHGFEGWEVVLRLTDSSFLMKRSLPGLDNN